MAVSNISEHDFVFAKPLKMEDPYSRIFMNALLRGFTHKLNNLLAVVEGFSSLILMSDDPDETVTESLQHMRDAAKNASALSQRSLTAGGCVNINLQDLRLEDFLAMLDTTLREPFVRLGVPFEVNLTPSLPSIRVDASRLKEILAEVLKNAAEAASVIKGKSWLEVLGPTNGITSVTEPLVHIFIHNTGSEIPFDKLGEIFRPFYSTKDTRHFGLGLTITSVLAGQMNIRIGVRSKGGTTTMWIMCPLAG